LDSGAITYSSFGGCRTYNFIGNVLEVNAQNFGTAIKEIEIDLLFASKPGTIPRKTLESLYETFYQNLDKLPALKFLRKSRIRRIDFSCISNFSV